MKFLRFLSKLGVKAREFLFETLIFLCMTGAFYLGAFTLGWIAGLFGIEKLVCLKPVAGFPASIGYGLLIMMFLGTVFVIVVFSIMGWRWLKKVWYDA